VRPYEAVALKDVVWLNTNEEVNIIARYAPWDGLYMVSNVQPFHSNRVTHVSDVFGFSRFSRFLKYVVAMLTRLQFHCHNLIHEDHEMMAALNVTALSDLGYDEKTRFIDPMEPRYRAKPFADADFVGRTGDFSSSAIQEKVKFFNNLDAYRFAGETEEKLEAYWKTKSLGGNSPTPSSTATSSTATTLATSTTSGAGVTTTGSSASSSQGSVTTTKSSTSSTKKDDDKTKTTKSSSSSKKKDDDDKKTTTTSSAQSASKTTTAKTTTTKK